MRTRHVPAVRRALPGLEPLEGRDCPSSILLHGHTLLIDGGNANNTLTIRDNGVGGVTASVVDSAGHHQTLTAHGVQQIQVTEGKGNDHINYALTGTLKTSEQIHFTIGAGSDQVNLDLSKGVSAPTLGIRLDGGKGSDAVNAVFGNITGTKLDFVANLGVSGWPGSDEFHALFKGNLTGAANVTLNVHDGNGYDGLAVKVQGNIGAQAQMTIHVQGGTLPDTLHADYQGRLDGKLTIEEDGGPGGDLVGSDVTLAAGSKGTLSDHLHGGDGGNLLVLRVIDHSHHMKKIDTLVTGGRGFDQALVSKGVKVSGASV